MTNKRVCVNVMNQTEDISFYVDVLKQNESFEPEVMYEKAELRRVLIKFLEKISTEIECEPEKVELYLRVVKCSFGLLDDSDKDYKSYAEVAKDLGLDRIKVHYIVDRFMRRLKKEPYRSILVDYIS